jgi:hypothetical protein
MMNEARAHAFRLLREEIYTRLDEVEFFAMNDVSWGEEDEASARTLLCDLVTVVRTVAGLHAENDYGRCKFCLKAWPCPSIDSIHRSMRNPDAELARLHASA